MEKIKKISLLILFGFLFLSLCQPVIADAGKININTATQKELVMLKNVGIKLAERIIEYRKDNPFQKPEDIMKVKGIGQKVFDANKDVIVVKDE